MVFPLNNMDIQCAYTISSVEFARMVTAWYWAHLDAGSAQLRSSCFAHLFCTDGSSTSLLTHNSVIIMENANITHNRGHVLIYSFEESTMVKFHGSNTFTNNNNHRKDFVLPVLHLIQCNATVYGNTTFLQNKGRDGGAICAELAEINFQM